MASSNILAILKEMILDFQSEEPAVGCRRRFVYEIVPRKAFVCIGVRRCGKSTLLYQIVDALQRRGIKRQNILYLNFFDDRLEELRREGLAKVMEAYFSLFPEKKGVEKVYCIFDELQEVNNWEAFIDRILRTEKCEVYISGSSAKLLSKEIASQMRGRSLSWELFPFSFSEYLDFNNIEVGAATSRTRYTLQKHFESYWESGGFPEVLNVTPKIRIQIHQEYFKTIIHRDIIERFDALHPQAVIDAAFRLLGSVSSLYSINRITDYLKSLGHKVSKGFVGECLQWFEDAYFLFSTQLYDTSAARRNVNPKKIYCVDHSLVRSIIPGITEELGHLLETMVFVHIRRGTDEIYYYRTAHGNEIDFVAVYEKKEKKLIQVCYSLKNEQTRKREVSSLFSAMQELHINRATIVTFEDRETISDGGLTIDVIPAYRYFLSEK